MTYDFSGYATKHNIRCSDGRTIMPDAFKDCDGKTVPLVWQHVHDSVDNVLGHADLECRPDGVYAYCSLNETPSGEHAKELVQHGDICALSIYANRLQQVGQNVMHGVIREVSLVLAGANPGATIDNLAFAHADGTKDIIEDEACISFVDDSFKIILHSDDEPEPKEKEEEKPESSDDDETIGDIIDSMTEKQKQAVYALIGSIVEEKEGGSGEEGEVKHSDSDTGEAAEAEEEEAIEHADSEDGKESEEEASEETIQDVLDTLSDEQKTVLEKLLKLIGEGPDSVDDEEREKIAKRFDTFSDKQKNAVYALVGLAAEEAEKASGEEVKHSDADDIEKVLGGMDERQLAAVSTILEAVENGEEEVDASVKDIYHTMTDEQKDVVKTLVEASKDGSDEEDGSDSVEHSEFEGEEMTKHNVFESEIEEGNVLSHDDMKAIFADAPRYGSLKEAALQHGITDIEVLFPEAQAVNREPYQIVRRMEWVSTVLNGVHKNPFSRIKSTAVNLTEEQARAKGYIKGRKKIEEQISALRRVTTPQTIYKLQKLDRDDVIDITDFDVVAWMKQEMRMMLDEEIARAILVGDGRAGSDPEKIFPDHVRPVWTDDDMYVIHKVVAAADATDYTKMIDEVVRARKEYKGSGNPVMFIGPDILTEMRLLKDQDNRFRYESDAKLAEAMRVSKIEEVELFAELTRSVEGKNRKLVAIILNLADYTVGADKGGEVTMFDDFDIDYNKMAYLIETRMSGALTMPKSAIAVEIQTTVDSTPEDVYEKVASPVVADISDYYEQDEYGRYIKTVDTAIISGKDYFELAD